MRTHKSPLPVSGLEFLLPKNHIALEGNGYALLCSLIRHLKGVEMQHSSTLGFTYNNLNSERVHVCHGSHLEMNSVLRDVATHKHLSDKREDEESVSCAGLADLAQQKVQANRDCGLQCFRISLGAVL